MGTLRWHYTRAATETFLNPLFFALTPTAALFRHKHLCSQVISQTGKTMGVKSNGVFFFSLPRKSLHRMVVLAQQGNKVWAGPAIW